MSDDCYNHGMANDGDHHGRSEYEVDNRIGLAPYPSFVRLPSDPCDNEHKSITSFLTLNTNESSCSNITLTTKKVQSLVDSEVESRNTWIPTMIMETSINKTSYQCRDIIPLILTKCNKFSKKSTCDVIRFSSVDYPIDGKFEGTGWKKLKKKICMTALDSGAGLYSNGSFGTKGYAYENRILKCNHGRKFSAKSKNGVDINGYRKSYITNDKKRGKRKGGVNLPRRRPSIRHPDVHRLCPFKVVVAVDECSFFIVGNQGNLEHKGHPRLKKGEIKVPTRFISASDRDSILKVTGSDVSYAAARNIYYTTSGRMLSSDDIAYIHGLKRKELQICDDSCENIMEYMSTKGFRFVSLIHRDAGRIGIEKSQTSVVNPGQSGVTPGQSGVNPYQSGVIPDYPDDNDTSKPGVIPTRSELYLLYNGGNALKEYVPLNLNEKEVLDYASSQRKALKTKKHQHLFMGVAWIIPDEYERFKKCPEAIHVDGTASTNKEKYILMTVSAKDRSGKMVTILRAFLPNQRNWAFKWLFCNVFPTLFESYVLLRVRVVISDGDSCECNQIDAAIKLFMPNAVRLRCGWHIIDRGMDKKVANRCYKEQTKSQRTYYQEFIKIIRYWMFSWMKPGYCVNKVEYTISKRLMYQYIHSVTEWVGQKNVDDVIEFVQGHVEVHEHNYLFYLRIDLRHFDEYTNSSHEGTNSGLKHCAGAVVPVNTFDITLTKLCNQATRKSEMRLQSTAKEVTYSKTWSKLKCADKLCTLCVSVLEQNLQNCSNYKTVKVWVDKWYVIRTIPHVTSVVPKFKRTYTITCKNEVFYCSCKYFERNGIPCHHQLAVLMTLPYYNEPSHHDISVVWWNHYMYHRSTKTNFCENNEATGNNRCDNDELAIFYRYLEINDIKGPSYDQKYIDAAPVLSIVPKEFHDCLRVPNCINYDTSHVNHLAQEVPPFGLVNATNVHPGSNVTFQPAFQLVSGVTEIKNVWEELSPSFKELVSCLEDESEVTHLNVVKSWLDHQIALSKSRQFNKTDNECNKFVSVNLATNKKRKTHGTKNR